MRFIFCYSERSGSLLETWRQYYLCEESLYDQAFLIVQFLRIYCEHLKAFFYRQPNFFNLFETDQNSDFVLKIMWNVNRHDISDVEQNMAEVTATTYKRSHYSEFHGDFIPQYREISDFLIRNNLGIIFSSNWVMGLGRLFCSKSKVDEVFEILFRKFGDCPNDQLSTIKETGYFQPDDNSNKLKIC